MVAASHNHLDYATIFEYYVQTAGNQLSRRMSDIECQLYKEDVYPLRLNTADMGLQLIIPYRLLYQIGTYEQRCS